MAVERNAQSVDFGGASQAGAAPTAVGFVAPDFNKYADPTTPKTTDSGTLTDLLHAITPGINKLASTEVSTAREESYLSGQAAAASGAAQESVDSNIFTKDWATAGYRDVRGRMAQADAEAQTAVDMKQLREKSPAEMKEYLDTRRSNLMESMPGMSMDARKGFLVQQMASDKAAVEKHAVEHQKFVIDQIGKAVQTDMSVRMDGMTGAKTDTTAYLAATNNAYAGIYGNVYKNSNLPEDVRNKLVTEGATLALAQGHLPLYEQMRDTQIEGGGSMLDHLPFDDQVKLSASYKQARQDTAGMRLSGFATQLGLMKASWQDPLSPPMAYNDVKSFIDNGLQMGAIKTPEEQTALIQSWAEANEKKSAGVKLAQAYASGDSNTIFALGKSEDEGFSAYIQQQARNKVDPAETVGQLLQIGMKSGAPSAFKGVGELTRSAVASLGTAGTIDTGKLNMLNTVLKQLDSAQDQGHKQAMSAYLGAFSEDDRAKIMMYREELARTGDSQTAAINSADKLSNESQMSKEQRNVMAMSHAQADLATINDITPNGLWGTIKNAVIPNFVRSDTAIAENKITAGQSWFENPERVQQALAQSKVATMEELNYISRSHPYLSDDARKQMAYTAVADRTLQLKDGPLVTPRLPTGTTIQDYFGVSKSIGTTTIASALDDLHKAGDGNRVIYKANGQGQLQWQELGKNGEVVNPGGVMDPKSVASLVQAKQDKLTDEFNKHSGAGVTAKGPDGSSVRFNGNNTVGVDNDVMLQFRQDLTKMESVRNVPYDDASGKVVNGKRVQTVGVGVSSHNEFYPKPDADGKVSDQAISDSFTLASNAAARAGVRAQQDTGLRSPAAFRLLSQLSYQGGTGFAGNNKDFINALRQKEPEAAIAALHSSVPYKMAHAERRSLYDTLTRQAISGG